MTGIPSMVPPTAQPASSAPSRGGTPTAGGVAAAFSAIVAAVTAELASDETVTPETMVALEAVGDTVEADAETAVVAAVDEVTRSLMAASLLGVGAAPAPIATPDSVTEPTAESPAAIVPATGDSPALGGDLAGATEVSTVGAGQATADDAAVAPATPEQSHDGENTLPPIDGNGVTRAGGAAPDADAGTESADGTVPAETDATVDQVADTTVGDDAADDAMAERPLVSAPTNPAVSTEGVPATAPAPAPTAVGAVTDTSPSDGPVAPALPDQLVEVLAPLRRAPDGTHRMAIQLRPDELGDVQIEFQIRGNEISLNLRADLASTNDLLRESLAQLRAELDAAGFRSGTLDVADHGDGRAQGDPTDHGPGGSRLAADVASDDIPNTEPTSAATGLDLRL